MFVMCANERYKFKTGKHKRAKTRSNKWKEKSLFYLLNFIYLILLLLLSFLVPQTDQKTQNIIS